LVVVALIAYDSTRIYSTDQAISGILCLTILITGFAFVAGLLFSCALFAALELTRILFRRQQRDRSSYIEEIRWLTPDEQPAERR
jgi:hypothetical protein